MNKIIYKITLLFIAVSLVSCEKGLMNFDNNAADVYFADAGKNIAGAAFDSTYVSFSYTQSQDSVRKIIVAITGGRVDHDREYKVEVNPLSTAISGVHFEALPQKFVIKKNMLTDTIKLKLIRTPEMQTTSFFVVLDLLASESFGTNWKTRAVSGKIIKTTSAKILFNDIIKKPSKWQDTYFGTFSRAKLFFICEDLGITPLYMDTDITAAEINALSKIVQRHLNQLQAAGKTVYEADGITIMRMGPSAQ